MYNIPCEVWRRKKLRVDFAHVPSQLRTQLDNKSMRSIMVGYALENKCF